MITDGNIDKSTARYWCIFADKQLEEKIKTACEFSAQDGKNLKDVLVAAQRKAENAKSGVNESSGPLDVKSFLDNFMNPQNMLGMSGNPFCPDFRDDAPVSIEDQQLNSAVAGAVVAAGSLAVANPGAWGALGAAVLAFINGTSLLSGIVSHVGLAGLSCGITAAIGGIVSISSWLYPRMAKWIRDLKRTGVIARCEFTSNGTPYAAVYSLSQNKWQLLYRNSRWFRRGVKVDEKSVDNFFTTQFFQRFAAQCKKYVSAFIDDDQSFKLLEVLADMSDKKSAEQLKLIVKSRSEIQKNMYTGTYMTESASNIQEK